MTSRTITVWIFAGVLLFNPCKAFAQCGQGYVAIADILSQDAVEIVFSGVVTQVERTDLAETVTFDVDTVWKGSVGSRISISRPAPSATVRRELAPITFEKNMHYLVAAHRLSASERNALGVRADAERFGTDVCGGGSRPFAVAQIELAKMAPGRSPGSPLPRTSAVTVPIKIKDAAPEYPPGVSRDIRGTVVLDFTIDETGKVTDPRILRSIPALDQAAIACVLKWQYTPTRINGEPKPVRITASIAFGTLIDPLSPRPIP